MKGRSSLRRRSAAWVLPLAFFVTLLFVAPALADYLGPDRHVVEMVQVRDPANDYWTCGNSNPPPGILGTCILHHPQNPCPDAGGHHPSKEQQQAWCQWGSNYGDYTGCGCTPAYAFQTIEYDLPEATIAGDLQGCTLNNGWCVASTSLFLQGAEPLLGYEIVLLEGTRNTEPFACPGSSCSVPLLEGDNAFTYWALSSYGDSSRMGMLSARVDTVGPISAFTSPPERSTLWASGVVELVGVSSDTTSGLAWAEVSLDGGATWVPLGLSPGGTWGTIWDTRLEPDATRAVLVRAWDQAGNRGDAAQVTLSLDNTPPSVDLPDRWMIWEPIPLTVEDAGIGVKQLELSIEGGELGVRKFRYTPATMPAAFTWDRRIEGVLAPVGEYRVTLEAWDVLGNRGTAQGLLVIPEPSVFAPVLPEPTSAGDGLSSGAVPATETLPSLSSLIPAASTPTEAGLAEAIPSGPQAPLPSSEAATAGAGVSGVLWGAAALALIGSTTAYVLSRREERRKRAAEELAAKEREAAAWAAQAAGLKARVDANRRAATARALALAAAAAEATRRVRDRWMERREQAQEEREIAARERAEARAGRRAEAQEEARQRAAAVARAEAIRQVAERRDAELPAVQAETPPPPIALRALTAIVVIPVLFVADITTVVLTVLVSTALAADPEPLTKLGLAVAEVALAAADIYVAFQHVNYAHWLVTGRPIRSMEDLSNWNWQP